MKIDTLAFLNILIANHPADVFHPHLQVRSLDMHDSPAGIFSPLASSPVGTLLYLHLHLQVHFLYMHHSSAGVIPKSLPAAMLPSFRYHMQVGYSSCINTCSLIKQLAAPFRDV